MNQSTKARARILLVAHSCRPEIGSEPTVGWNRALAAAEHYATWVLCDEEYNRAAIELYLARNGAIENLQFVYVPPGRADRLLRRISGSFYLHYNLWHRRAFKLARVLHQKQRFDLVHQVNLCGFREPGYTWRLDAPFVWGPVGGTQNYPWRFLPAAGMSGALGEAVRNVLNLWQVRFARRVGKAARRAEVFLAANSSNACALAPRRGSMPQIMLETGAPDFGELPPRKFDGKGALRILWSGVFEHRKALHLLLEAIAALPSDVRVELRILGRGPLEQRWRKLAHRLNVERYCQWLGWIDRDQTLAEYLWADVFAFTSLRDLTGNVVVESLAAGTPVVCFDHQGAGEVVTSLCGLKIPVTTPARAVRELRETIVRLCRNRQELEQLSQGARQRAADYTWQRQSERMSEVYAQVLETAAYDCCEFRDAKNLADRELGGPTYDNTRSGAPHNSAAHTNMEAV